MDELKEVSAILDTGKVELEDLQSAMQAILFHQCLYEDWPHAPSYRLLVRHIAQVQPILAAFGYGLRHHPVAHMLVLEPISQVYGLQMSRLKKDETAVLIVLRLLYAEGISALDENGRVEATTDDIHDRLKTCGEEPPLMARLLDILKTFHRKGLVRVGEHDAAEQLTVVTIMPGVTILVSDVYVEAVIQWLEARALERLDAEGALGLPLDGAATAASANDSDAEGIKPEGECGPDAAKKPDLPADMLSAVAAYRDALGSATDVISNSLVPENEQRAVYGEEPFSEKLDSDDDWRVDDEDDAAGSVEGGMAAGALSEPNPARDDAGARAEEEGPNDVPA